MRKQGVLSILLTAALVVGIMPSQGVSASTAASQASEDAGAVSGGVTNTKKGDGEETEEAAVSAEGTLADGSGTEEAFTWSLEEGVLTIVRSEEEAAAMPAYTSSTCTTAVPWYGYAAAIQKVVFKGAISALGNYTFYNAKSAYSALTEVDFSGIAEDTTITVGNYAFTGASSAVSPLTTITGASKITSVGSYCFQYTSVTEFTAENLTTLGASAFQKCTALKTVALDAVQSISNASIFNDCTALQSISLKSLTTLSGYSFLDCTNITKISSAEEDKGQDGVCYMPSITSISPSMTFISGGASSVESVELESLTTLSGPQFNGCTALTKVSLPNVTTISGNNTFKGCTSLTSISQSDSGASVYIPSLTTASGSYTYANCTSLTSADLSSLTGSQALGYAFQNCTALNDVDLQNITTLSGSYVFDACTALTDDSIDLTNLTTISGSDTFRGCTGFSDFSLDSVTSITGSNVFENCSNMTGIRLKNVTQIATKTFIGCVSLVYAYLPNLTTYSSSYGPFWYCDSLQRLYVNSSFTDTQKFWEQGYTETGTTGSTTLTYLADVTIYIEGDSAAGIAYYSTKNTNSLSFVDSASDTVAKEDVITYTATCEEGSYEITGSAAVKSGNTDFTYEYYEMWKGYKSSVTRYTKLDGQPTAAGTYGVKAVVSEVTGGEQDYFATTSNFVSYEIIYKTLDDADGNEEAFTWDVVDGVLTIARAEGADTAAAMPDYTTSTYKTAVPWRNHFDEITTVKLTGAISKLGNYTFYNQICSQLTTLDLSGITADAFEVGKYAFAGSSYSARVPLATITGQDKVTTLGMNAFMATEIEEVEMPNVTTIENDYPFYGCQSLKSAVFSNLTSITSTGVFQSCISLETASFPKLRLISGTQPFMSCTSLETVGTDADDDLYLPKLTENSGASLIRQCTGVKEVSLEVTVIGAQAFYQCTSLETVDLPNVEALDTGNYIFYQCTSLTEVNLPEVSEITGQYEFGGCTSLTSISLPSLVTVTGATYMFSGCTSLQTVDMPYIKVITNYMFQNCTSLESYSNDKITSIGEGAFYGCTSLQTVSMIKATSLGSTAFYECSSLKSARLDKVTSLSGTQAFFGCINMVYLYAPSVISWTSYPFGYCDSLQRIYLGTLSSSVSTINMQNGTDETSSSSYAYLTGVEIYLPSDDYEAVAANLSGYTEIEGNSSELLISCDDYEAALAKEGNVSITAEADSGKLAVNIAENTGSQDLTYYYYQKYKGNISAINRYKLVNEEDPTALPTETGDYAVRAVAAATDDYAVTVSNYADFTTDVVLTATEVTEPESDDGDDGTETTDPSTATEPTAPEGSWEETDILDVSGSGLSEEASVQSDAAARTSGESYNGYIQTLYESALTGEYLKVTYTVDDSSAFTSDTNVFNFQPFDSSWGGWQDNYITFGDSISDSETGSYTAYIAIEDIKASYTGTGTFYGINISFAQAEPSVTLTGYAMLTAADSTDDEEMEAAKTALSETLTTAASLTESDYTAESWAVLKEAIAAAEALGDTATADDYAAAKKAVEEAVAALVTASSTSDENEGNGNTGEDGNSVNDSSSDSSQKVTVKKATLKSVKSKKKKTVTVKWKKLSGVTGYQVQIGTNKKVTKGKKSYKVKKAKTTSKTIKKLKSKKTYYVRVRAYKTVNGKTTWGKWSKVKKVKVK